ncbi:MAG: sugar transferase [Chloroflexota bacterium]
MKRAFDDLPTLWNVLRGDISLIGPRPEMVDKVDLADPRWQKVLSVKPGLVGMRILSLRETYSQTAQSEQLRRELIYVENQSFWFDMRLLFSAAYWWLRMGHIKGPIRK